MAQRQKNPTGKEQMQQIFLSYTFNPHPDHANESVGLALAARRVIEAMGLRVLDGTRVGGRALDEEIERRILEADAFVALLTPQEGAGGTKIVPQFVMSEFQMARAMKKERIRLIHEDLDVTGLGAAEEFLPFEPGKLADAVVKLMQTIALWKKRLGRSLLIRIEPKELASKFKREGGDSCRYELKGEQGERSPELTTEIWAEPGAAFVVVPNFIEGSKVCIRLTVRDEEWQSQFVTPQMDSIWLERETN
jgi:hypothetical protein